MKSLLHTRTRPFKASSTLVLLAATAIIALCPMPSRTPTFAESFIPAEQPMSLTISSPSFTNGGAIPKKFTCDAADVSPHLSWTDPPAGTKSFALLVDDPDAPIGNWNHWAMWNLPTKLRSLPEALSKNAHLPDGSEQGMNDFHKPGYNGPCPPAGKPHRYFFKLFALDTKLALKGEAGKPEMEAAMKGHILAQAEWVGTYKR